MLNKWIDYNNKIPNDFGLTEIAWGYIEEPALVGTVNRYAPIYFSDGDWYISGESKKEVTQRLALKDKYTTKKSKLIAYFRFEKYE